MPVTGLLRSLMPPLRSAGRLRRRKARDQDLPELLEARLLLSSPETYSLVADLYSDTTRDGSYPESLTQVGTTTYFVARTLAHGDQLWKSNGTAAGTVPVTDIRPGLARGFMDNLTNANGTLFFSYDDGVAGRELWKSDGTPSGTVRVRDIVPGTAGSSPDDFVAAGSLLFFLADDGVNVQELWKSDGTNGGTVMVRNIGAGGDDAFINEPVAVGSTLFFQAYTAAGGAELWKSDGTTAGTVVVREINPGSDGAFPQLLTNVGGTLFFGAYDPVNGYALWKSNGTSAGTVVVRSALPYSSAIDHLTAVGSTLYFSYDDGTHGEELWKSDGTTAGTVMVRDISAGYDSSWPRQMQNVAGTLFFAADNGATGFELWKSDGSAAGTVLVRDIDAGYGSGYPRDLTNVNGVVYFSARSSGNDYELWKSNGTAGGTVLVKDVSPGSSSSQPSDLFNANGKLLFSADDGVSSGDASKGGELWVSNGTAAGTVLLKDIQGGTGNAEVTNLVNLNGTLIFTGNNGSTGRDALWKLNGSTPELIRDIWPGSDLTITRTAVAGNLLFFAADSGNPGQELWVTDGTTAGTVMVRDINPTGGSFPLHLTAVGNRVYFSAYDGANGRELWRTDGTAAGTVMVKDIAAGSDTANPQSLANIGGTLYFSAKSSGSNYELWKSDGTSAGTVLVRDIRPGSGGSFPYAMTNLNGTVFFIANDGTNGSELWKSDGTSGGTTLVKNINPGIAASLSGSFTAIGSTLFFSANDGTHGTELWKSDGTAAGTVLVRDIRPGSSGGSPASLRNLDGSLVFVADDGISGTEVWISNGTAAGTVQLLDIHAGAAGSAPKLSVVGNRLWINANDGIHGERGWVSDGTASGTVMAISAAGQPDAVDPGAITEVNGAWFFSAVSAEHGRELFRIESSQVSPPGSAPSITAPPSPTGAQRPTISWNAVGGATAYEVWIKNQSTGVNPFYTVTVATTSCVPTIDLGIGRFNLWVRAVNAGGSGPWSSQYNFTVDTRAEADDPGRYQSTHRPALTWAALPGAVAYDLWIDDRLGGVSQYIRNQNVTSTTWTPTADMPLGLYHAWVRGVSADGTAGLWSTTMIFYVMPAPHVTAGMNPTFDRTPVFAWDVLTGAVRYEVYIRNRNTGTTTWHQQNITGTAWTPPTDLADGPYRVWVIGVSAANVRSFWTDPADINVGGPTDLLTPRGTTDDTTPTFTWRPMDGADRYDLWVDQVGGASQIIRQQNLSATSYTATALPSGNYRAWIRAISTLGEVCPWSVTAEFVVAESDAGAGEDENAFSLPLPVRAAFRRMHENARGTAAVRLHPDHADPPAAHEQSAADGVATAAWSGLAEQTPSARTVDLRDAAMAWWADRPLAAV